MPCCAQLCWFFDVAVAVLLHTQEVQLRKLAQKEADKLRGDLDKLKPQLSAANSRAAELQAANAALKVSVHDLKQRLMLAGDAEAPAAVQRQGSRGPSGAGAADVAALQQQLAQSEAAVLQLRQQLDAAQRQQQGAAPDPAAQQQLAALQQQVAALQEENQALRSELGAFDPAFFEELEDLKHSHHQLQQKAVVQANLIRRLQHQLSSSGGSSSQRASSTGVGAEGSSGSGIGGRSTRLAP
jgi:centrosomal protein CEP290